MEHITVKALLEKYFLAETTVEEEKTLAAYFSGPDIDPGLEPFRELFAYFEEEAKVTPGEDFESRILERIHRADAEAAATPAAAPPAAGPAAPIVAIPSVQTLRRWWNPAYAAAAAVILSIGLFLMYQPSRSVGPVTGPDVTAESPAVQAQSDVAIKDTYDDPQQALAAIRRALLVASTRMNQGRNIAQKNVSRLKKLNYGQL
jgi:hypothetical protein